MNDASTLARLTPPARDAFTRWRDDQRCEAFWPDLDQRLASASSDDAVLAELEDAFCRPLPIGTGGRRGPVGPGTNRMNEIVLRETAAGLARWVKESGGEMLAVVVYDTRRDSRHFAWVVSHALVAQGMRVRLLDAPRPTPQLSWELRESGAGAGVVISASHNPAGDNGIKIYGPDGAQVLGEDDARLMRCIVEVSQAGAFAPIDMQAVRAGQWPAEVSVIDPGAPDPKFAAGGRGDAGYHEFVLGQGVLAGDLSDAPPIAYTPLHGVGQSAVLPVLGARGLKVSIVEAQLDDGGEFGTVRSANPEAPAALDMVGALALQIGASLAVANDPDADRLGALVRNASGEMEFIDGNRLGVLMLDHLVRHAARPEGARVTITLVTTPLLATMARAAGLEAVDDILVGFKNHAGLVREDESKPVFFMCEESHGYTRGLQVRDKDGAVAALLLAEAMVDAHRAGVSLHDRLAAVWAEHGYHRERTRSLWARGAAGRQAIAAAMSALRTQPPTELSGLRVKSVVDRQAPRSTGSPTRDLTGNVLVFELQSETQACRLVLRPSGTEPKLKVYALARGPLDERAQVDALIEQVLDAAESLASQLMAPLLES